MLICSVNELATGQVSDATKGFLSSLSRPLAAKAFEVTHLCALNVQVTLYNKLMLQDVKSKEIKFLAEDSGKVKVCAKMQVEKVKFVYLTLCEHQHLKLRCAQTMASDLNVTRGLLNEESCSIINSLHCTNIVIFRI